MTIPPWPTFRKAPRPIGVFDLIEPSGRVIRYGSLPARRRAPPPLLTLQDYLFQTASLLVAAMLGASAVWI